MSNGCKVTGNCKIVCCHRNNESHRERALTCVSISQSFDDNNNNNNNNNNNK